MSTFIEIGRVGGWRYVVAIAGNPFEVLRQDIKYDQVEELLAFETTFKKASNRARLEMQKHTKRKRQLKFQASRTLVQH